MHHVRRLAEKSEQLAHGGMFQSSCAVSDCECNQMVTLPMLFEIRFHTNDGIAAIDCISETARLNQHSINSMETITKRPLQVRTTLAFSCGMILFASAAIADVCTHEW